MRMVLGVAMCASALLVLGVNQLRAAEPELAGRWKLVVSPLTDTEFLILDAKDQDGKLEGTVVNAVAGILTAPKVQQLKHEGDKVSLMLVQGATEDPFIGKLVKEGSLAGQVLGTLRFRGVLYAARLERTEAEKTERASPPADYKLYSAALQERDPKARIQKLQATVEETSGPIAAAMYGMILQGAAAAELSVEDVQRSIQKMLAVGEIYGEPLVAEYRNRALKAISGKKPYAGIALEMAQQADKQLGPNASPQQQAAVLAVLASSARLLEKKDLADATDARLEKIEAALDEEYHRTVPPFKPEAFAGRAQADQDRVVLMELFTGAQCPPCVAADVAFDALIKSYQPKELVTLQYHLHIPGPDPLTNADAVARAKYYAANSTPTTFFNGVADARGGGGMANAESKFGQYRGVIDGQLAAQKPAKIDLKATRSGHNVVIVATAQTVKPADAKAEDKKEPQLRLRLVLTEESIRYVGGNQLRFHHHVVRGFPGGVEGKELVADQCTSNETVDLNQVRQTLNDYLATYQARSPFPNPLPPIDLKNLAVVAFIQNDADKSILHAVTVPVPNE